MAEEYSEEISAEFLQNIQSAVDASGVIGRVEVIQTENGPMTVIFMDDNADTKAVETVTSETIIGGSDLQNVAVVTEPESVQFETVVTEPEVIQYSVVTQSENVQYDNVIEPETVQYNNVTESETVQYNNVVTEHETAQYDNVTEHETAQFNNVVTESETEQYNNIVTDPETVQYNNVVLEPEAVQYRNVVVEPEGLSYRNVLTDPGSLQYGTTEVEVSSVSDILTSYATPPVTTTSQVEAELSATPFIPQVNDIYQEPSPSAPVITETIVNSPLVNMPIDNSILNTDSAEQEETFTATPLFQFASTATAQSKVALSQDMFHTKPTVDPKVVMIRKPNTGVFGKHAIMTEPLYTSHAVSKSDLVGASTLTSLKQIVPKAQTRGVRYSVTNKQDKGIGAKLEQMRAVESIVSKQVPSTDILTTKNPSVQSSPSSFSYVTESHGKPIQKQVIVSSTLMNPSSIDNLNKQRTVKRFIIPKYTDGEKPKVVEFTGNISKSTPYISPTVVKSQGKVNTVAMSTQAMTKTFITSAQSCKKVDILSSEKSPVTNKRLVEVINEKGQVNVVQLDTAANLTYVDSHGRVLTAVETDESDPISPNIAVASSKVLIDAPTPQSSHKRVQKVGPARSPQINTGRKSHPVSTQITTAKPRHTDIPAPQAKSTTDVSTPKHDTGFPTLSSTPTQKTPTQKTPTQKPPKPVTPSGLQKVRDKTEASNPTSTPGPQKPASATSSSSTQTVLESSDDEDILQTIEVPNSEVIVHIFKDGSLQTKDKSGRSYSKISLESLGVKPEKMSKGANIELVVVQPNGKEVKASIHLDLKALKASQQQDKCKPVNVETPEPIEKLETVESDNLDNEEETEMSIDNQISEQNDKAKSNTELAARPYQCSLCPRTFKFKGTFVNHEAVHQRETFFTCLTCERVFAREENLTSHMKLHDQLAKSKSTGAKRDVLQVMAEVAEKGKVAETIGLSCEFCGWTQNSKKYSLIEHLDRLHNRSTIECPKCKKAFTNRAIFTKHMFLHSGPYTCPHCYIQKDKSDEMMTHMKQNHKNAIICEVCDELFGHRSGYRAHMKAFHPNYKSAKFTTKETKYECKDCGYRFAIYANLMKHKLQHTIGTWQCSQCSQKFGSQSILSKHTKQAHTATYTTYNCDKCCMKFKRKDFFETHKEKFHTGPYNCNECGIELAELKDLNAHRYTKHGVGLICKICGTKFERRMELIKHKESEHRRPANYLCDLCGAGFVHRTFLKSHIIHEHFNGDRFEVYKAYPELKLVTEKCELCREVLKDQFSAKLHYLNKHFQGNAEEMYETYPFLRVYADKQEGLKCDYCEKVFISMLNLQRHLIRHGVYLDLVDKAPESDKEDNEEFDEDKESEVNMETDIVDIQPRSEAHKKDYQCSMCQQRFARKSALNRHEDTHKTNDFLIALKQLEKDEQDRMNKIMKEDSIQPSSPKKEKKESNLEFKCSLCDMRFKKEFKLKHHMKESHGKKRGRPFAIKPAFTEVKEKTKSKGRGRPPKLMSGTPTTVGDKEKNTALVKKEKKTQESSRGRGRPPKHKSEGLPETLELNRSSSRPPKDKNERLSETPETNRGRGRPPKDKSERLPETPETNRGRGRPPKDKNERLPETPKSNRGRGIPPKDKSDSLPETSESNENRGRPSKNKNESLPETPESKRGRRSQSNIKSEINKSTSETRLGKGRTPKENSLTKEKTPESSRKKTTKDNSEIIEKTPESSRGRVRPQKDKSKSLHPSEKLKQVKLKTPVSSSERRRHSIDKIKVEVITPGSTRGKSRTPKDKLVLKQKTPNTVKGRGQVSKGKSEVKQKTPVSDRDIPPKLLKEKSPEALSPVETKEMDIETFLGSNFSLGKKPLPPKSDDLVNDIKSKDINDAENVNLEDSSLKKSKETEVSKPETGYSCKICSSVYNTLNGIRKHLEIFHPMVRNTKDDQYVVIREANELQEGGNTSSYFPCQLCPKAFEKEANLKRHVTLKHFAGKTLIKSKPVVKDEKKTDKNSAGKKHKRKNSSVAIKPALKRIKYPSSFKFKTQYLLNMKKERSETSKSNKKSKNLPQTKVGKIVRQTSSEGFPCESCSKTFKKLTNLALHVKVDHRPILEKLRDKESELFCTICEKYFANIKQYETHLQNYHKSIWEGLNILPPRKKKLSTQGKIKKTDIKNTKRKERFMNDQNEVGSEERPKKKRKIETQETVSSSTLLFSATSDPDVADKSDESNEIKVRNEFQCEYCTDGIMLFMSEEKLADHLKHRHGKTFEMSKSSATSCVWSFFCQQCHRVFWTDTSYTDHMKNFHPDRLAIELDSRVKEQMSRQLQKQGILSPSSPRKSSSQGPTKFKCEFCKRVHWTKRRFEEHMIEQHYDEAIKNPGAYGLVLEQPVSSQSSSQSNTLKVRLGNDEGMNMEQLSASSTVVLEKLPLGKMINVNRDEIVINSNEDAGVQIIEPLAVCSMGDEEIYVTKNEDFETKYTNEQNESNAESVIEDQSIMTDTMTEQPEIKIEQSDISVPESNTAYQSSCDSPNYVNAIENQEQMDTKEDNVNQLEVNGEDSHSQMQEDVADNGVYIDVDVDEIASAELPVLFDNTSIDPNNSLMASEDVNMPELKINVESETQYIDTEKPVEEFSVNPPQLISVQSCAIIEESDIEELAPLKDGDEILDMSSSQSQKSEDELIGNGVKESCEDATANDISIKDTTIHSVNTDNASEQV